MLSRRRAIFATLFASLVLLLAACSPTPPEKAATPAVTSTPVPIPNATFVGNAACEPCHAAEFKSHQNTRHAQTLRPATRSGLGALAPPMGPLPEEGSLAWEQDRLHIVAPNKETSEPISAPLDLVLGSGKTGMTYLALDLEGSLEMRHSYFPHEKKWIVTPGQESFESVSIGWIHPKEDSARCIGCHSVVLPANSLMPERKFFGVGCESCHGPGSEHVAMKQRGDTSTKRSILSLKGIGGAALNENCGRCHRTPGNVAQMDEKSKQSTSRFMPYALSLSRCFTQSNDKLSCVTCHNSHENASTDIPRYEKTCVSCHSAPKKVCPVNPKEKCVSCHMPKKGVFPGTDFPIQMADHFIRIYKNGKPTR